jgi:NitT/TauT family transport system substrate-binding protein
MDQLRISATAHGVNYLPEYYAASSCGFADRGLAVESRACEVWTGVLDDLGSEAADIVLGGLWVPAMYAGIARDLVAVGQLNGRFPMVIVTREPVEAFDWSWMKGRTVLVPGAGGTAPYAFTAGLMSESGADPAGTQFVRDLSSDMLTELFLGGLGDAIVCDLLGANWLAYRGAGSQAQTLADIGGPMPNSVYYVRGDRLAELRDRLVRFMAAIGRSMTILNAGTASDFQEVWSAHWPDVPAAVVEGAVAQLIANGTWSGIAVDQAASERWVDMLRSAGLVARSALFEEFVDSSVAADAERLLAV